MFSCAQLTLGYLNAQALLEERFHAVSANHFLRSTISYGNGLSRTLDRSQDNLLRPSGFQLMNRTTEEHATSYGYDTAGRLAGVHTAAAYSATPDFGYNYLANSGSLVESVTSPAHTVSNSYETTRNVLDVKSNATNGANPSVVSAFDYSVNNLGQRDDVSRSGSAFTSANTETWNYNAKGEVVTANHSTNNAFDRSFEFDGIGNRKKSAEGLDLTAPTATSYNTNALNQYSQITNAQISNRLHDADGNLIDDGTKLFVWDAENRLIEIKLKSDDSTVATYAYDYQSRRITKTVGSTVTNFVYDGWNPIAEYTSVLSPLSFTLSTSYTWGMDLSGSMQGAGGVGGLLSVNDGSATYYPTFDGNGNVSEYVDATGVVVAHYEYDAFGQVVGSGAMKDDFTHQFSTKQLDSESGLHYYGYRYYDSSNGRWLGRDPVSDVGSVVWFERLQRLYGKINHLKSLALDEKNPFLKEKLTMKIENLLKKIHMPSELVGGIGLYLNCSNALIYRHDSLGLFSLPSPGCVRAVCKAAAVLGVGAGAIAGMAASCLAPEPTGLTKLACAALWLGIPQLGVEAADAIIAVDKEC